MGEHTQETGVTWLSSWDAVVLLASSVCHLTNENKETSHRMHLASLTRGPGVGRVNISPGWVAMAFIPVSEIHYSKESYNCCDTWAFLSSLPLVTYHSIAAVTASSRCPFSKPGALCPSQRDFRILFWETVSDCFFFCLCCHECPLEGMRKPTRVSQPPSRRASGVWSGWARTWKTSTYKVSSANSLNFWFKYCKSWSISLKLQVF